MDRDQLHPIILQVDTNSAGAKIDGQFAHPINYFLQQEGMTRLWSKRSGLSIGGGGAASGTGAAAAGPAAQEVPAEPEVQIGFTQKKNFDVMLTGYDAASKVKIIKELKNILNLGLKEVAIYEN